MDFDTIFILSNSQFYMFNNIIESTPGFGKAKLEITVFKEEDQFIAYASALDVAAHGNSENEAIKNLAEVVSITLQWAKENNTFHELLLSNGWTLKEQPKPSYLPPAFNLQSVKSKFNITSIQRRSTLEFA